MTTQGSQSPEAEEPSDAELLTRIARSETDAPSATRAQAEFYARHVRYLYGALRSLEHKLLYTAGVSAEDLVQETFHRAFERAHTFSADEIDDADRLRRRARAWLGRIAQNLLADYLRSVREISATPYLESLSCEDVDQPSLPSRELRLICDGLRHLTEREQDVLRVTALYLRAGDHQRLPNAVSAELAERWGTTNENIRAIRSRALKKLRDFVSAHGTDQAGAP